MIVVDNGSTDGTSEFLSRRFPDADVLSLPTNEGFSRAVNRAARVARGDVLVLVNDDCVCEPGFVEHLQRAIDPQRSVVMAAGALLESGDPHRVDSAGLEVDDTLLVFDYLNGQPTAALDSAQAPFGPSGAAAAFDRSAFLEAGGFDEELFAYWEDVDLALRLRLDGALCATAYGARAVHSHSATLGSGSASKNYLTGYGRGYLLRKWGVLRGAPISRVLLHELAICAAQLVVDRTLTGISGRREGWRAAKHRERTYPAGLVAHGRRSVYAELRRRGGRRRRLGAARGPR